MTLYFNKFHPTDTTSLKIASFTRSGISTKSSDSWLQIFRGVLIVYTRKKKQKTKKKKKRKRKEKMFVSNLNQYQRSATTNQEDLGMT